MCENYEDPSESRNTQADGHRTTAELDSSIFNGESPVQISERTRALCCDTWEKFFDKDGRVVNESALRKAVFKGGIDCKIRREVWSFLFGLYPFSSTRRERDALSAENIARYQALKAKWKELMRTYQPPLEPDVPETVPLYLRECQNFHINNDPTADVENRLSGAAVHVEEMDASSHVGDEQLVFLNLTAKLHAERRHVDIKKLYSSIRVIDKDVPRTDRGHVYFQ